jgi:hypothetical protein
MIDIPLIDRAREWVVEQYPYNRVHLIRSLGWLDRVAPGSSEAVRLATLTHDMERAFPGPDQPVCTAFSGPAIVEYERLHSARSARIVGEWLRQQGASAPLVTEVERLIEAHEVGGWPEANLVQAADSLSFFDSNVDLFLEFVESGRFSAEEVAKKFDLSRDRIQIPALRELIEPMYRQAHARLKALTEVPSS